jgi:hypothetical protein
MRKRAFSTLLTMLALTLAASFSSFNPIVSAQTFGEITGVITDAGGAAVSGAGVTVTNTATGAVRTVTTNSEGIYSFPALLPGQYSVKIEQSGFKTAVRDNIQLQVQQTARIDVQLEIGSVGETVTVTGDAALLAQESTSVGTVIENKRIVDLPLNGRNFLQLVATAPNVSTGFQQAGQAGGRQGGIRSNQQISVAGQRSYFNRFTIDGIENTDVNFNTPIILPSIDALQEFKVQTGIYPAEFGRAATQINISTKSGTRNFHGTIFEFLRNDLFDARIYDFTGIRPPDTPKEPLRWNQYGFTVDGPVVLPKKFFGPIGYDNRERLFFMGNFEGFRERRTGRGRYQLPLAAWRNGDFSSLANPIFDPLSTRTENGVLVRSQFPGNIIPRNRLHPTALKLLEFYPSPNLFPDRLGINHEQPQGSRVDRDQIIGRGDFIESTKSNWGGRYSWGDEEQLAPALRFNGTKLITQVKQAMIFNTRTFGSNKVNETRFGYNSFFNSLGRELANVRDVVSELAIPGFPSGPPVSWGIPSISIQNFAGFGDDTEGPYVNNNKTYQIVNNFTWTLSNHTLKFGGEVRWDQYAQVGNQFARGSFIVEANATTNVGRSGTGNPFADFMLGYCKRCEVSVSLAEADFRARSQYYYFDDTWKVTPKLTVNLGLRYELSPPWLDKTGRLVNIFTPFLDNTPNVADRSRHPVFVRMGSGDFYEGLNLRFNPLIQTARDGRLGERLVFFDRNDFAPRLGIAYSPTSNWTIRTGGGVFYTQDTGNPRFDMARNLAGRRREEATPEIINLTFDQPFGNVPAGNVQVNNPYVLGNIPTRRTPYVIQYMLSIQRQLANNLLLEVNYLGSVGRKLESLRAFNESIPGTTGSVLSRAPYPEFGRIQQVDSSGKSNYNGLSGKLEKRFATGLTFLLGYTWSKSIDTASAIRSHGGDTLFPQNSYNLAAERGLSGFDVRHRFVGSSIYNLPFGRGRRFLDRGGITNVIFGGWELGVISTIQSGFPLTVMTGRDQSNIGAGFDRPNATGQEVELSRDERSAARWFNINAFVVQPRGTFGNVGRNTVIGPGLVQIDASLLKSFYFTERTRLQFRLEAFNAPNNPNLGNPGVSGPAETVGGTPINANFGRINGTSTRMREMQMALKLIF